MVSLADELLGLGFTEGPERLAAIVQLLREHDFESVSDFACVPSFAKFLGFAQLPAVEIDFLNQVSSHATSRWTPAPSDLRTAFEELRAASAAHGARDPETSRPHKRIRLRLVFDDPSICA